MGGVAVTIFSWYGPWAWPAWPALTAIHLVFGTGGSYQELTYGWRAIVLTLLIALNVAFWAGVAFVLTRMAGLIRSRYIQRRSHAGGAGTDHRSQLG